MPRAGIFILTIAVAWPALPAAQGDAPEADSRLQRGRYVEADTAVGRFSVGLYGVTEHARQQTTTGDVELGKPYTVEFEGVMPRLFEFKPFVFNRAETSEAAYYQSLGLGVGLQGGVRKKYADSTWFMRLSMLTPTDGYYERYGLSRELDSVYELFAGLAFDLGETEDGRDMRRRVARMVPIVMYAPPVMFEPGVDLSAELLGLVQAQIVEAYLARVAMIEMREGWRAESGVLAGLALIEAVTGEGLTPMQRIGLDDPGLDTESARLSRRREVVGEALRAGLVRMMRGPYPLVFQAGRLQGGGPLGLRPEDALRFRGSRPGMRVTAGTDPLNADAMILQYIKRVTDRLR